MGDYAFKKSTKFVVSNVKLLELIYIGNNCFTLVYTFYIDGLAKLKQLVISNNSFTGVNQSDFEKNSDDAVHKAMNFTKSFHILNCESLESIHIGEWSFSDYGGEFELKNLPSLQSIEIGSIGSDSCNFYYSSFVIRGIELILNIEFV